MATVSDAHEGLAKPIGVHGREVPVGSRAGRRVHSRSEDLDDCDWDLFKATIADPIFIDFPDWSRMEARERGRQEWADFPRAVFSGFAQRRQISNEDIFGTSQERFKERSAA